MWFLDGRAVSDVITAGQRPEPIPLAEWLRFDNPLDGAGPAADRLRHQLEAAAGADAPRRPESAPDS